MSLARSDMSSPDERDTHVPTPRRRSRGVGKDRLSALTAAPSADAEDEPYVLQEDDIVHRLETLRPVPPLPPAPPRPRAARSQRAPVTAWPVYDPFAARRRPTPEWLVRHTATVVAVDALAAVVSVLLARLVGAPLGWPAVAAAAVLWPLLVAGAGAYAERRQGTGGDEFRRVALAGLVAVAGAGIAGSLVDGALDGIVLVAAPLATVLSLVAHVANRWRLHRARAQGLMTKAVVVVGRDGAVLDLVKRIRRDPTAGLRVVGACVPRPRESSLLVAEGVRVLGGLDDVVRVLDEVRSDAVLVASASESSGSYLRELAWRLEGTRIDVLVGPGVIEVAPRRLQVRPTASMPLIQIQEPEFRGYRRFLKTALDRLVAGFLLLLTLPGSLAIVAAIRLTSPGPALFRHRRIGKQGQEFTLYKFRSMVADAPPDIALMGLNEGNEVQFKLRHDPRVTAVGRFLRRYSLDELPQLLNVLKGEMSLVGPRPHVTREVEMYGPDVHRRLLVKPGLTGLWQVSGRSDLGWDESVELDVRYVENWSLGLDLVIMWRTVRAVLRSSGAY
ncbi:sugar transferase [Geodermatophilus sp. URMC 64]